MESLCVSFLFCGKEGRLWKRRYRCCGCPDSQVFDVLDDSSEALPVSLVKHGLVDGWKASMIILAHLVDVNGSFVGQTERRQL